MVYDPKVGVAVGDDVESLLNTALKYILFVAVVMNLYDSTYDSTPPAHRRSSAEEDHLTVCGL